MCGPGMEIVGNNLPDDGEPTDERVNINRSEQIKLVAGWINY